MLTVSELQRHSGQSLANNTLGNYSLPIYYISNSSYQFINNIPFGLNSIDFSSEPDDAQYLAYSAYKKKIKRENFGPRYSETTCRKMSEELSSLVNIVVAYPGTWQQNRSRIEALQSIVKHADCQAIK